MKKQLKLSMLSALAVLLFATSCDLKSTFCEEANGPQVEQSFDLDAITDIELNINASVHITQGATQSVEIHGKEDAIENLKMDIVNGLWMIEFEDNKCMRNHELVIYITLVDVNSVDVSGSGDIHMDEDTIQLDHALEYRISGSGRINALLDVTEVDTRISGSGELNLAGFTNANNVRISGSGDINAFDLVSTNADINISGSGNAEVFVDGGVLDVKISGSGKVFYKGIPSSINVDISGSGDLVDAN